MSRALAEIARDAVELPPEDRLKLARMLLDVSDIPHEPLSEVETAWETEISNRIRSIDAGTAQGKLWEEVLANLNARLS